MTRRPLPRGFCGAPVAGCVRPLPTRAAAAEFSCRTAHRLSAQGEPSGAIPGCRHPGGNCAAVATAAFPLLCVLFLAVFGVEFGARQMLHHSAMFPAPHWVFKKFTCMLRKLLDLLPEACGGAQLCHLNTFLHFL